MNIDWQELVAQLETAGVTRSVMARVSGLSKSSLSELANIAGSQPRGSAAVALYELHRRRMKRHNRGKA